MQTERVTRRCQLVQRVLNGPGLDSTSIRKRVVILPDNSGVYVSGPTKNGEIFISIGTRDVLSYRALDRYAALVLFALGTPFEQNNSGPRYPILQLSAPTAETRSQTISSPDIWACVYALWIIFRAQENIPIVMSPSLRHVDTFVSYLLNSGLARRAADLTENVLFLLRGTFWQGAGAGPLWNNTQGWLRHVSDYTAFPHAPTFTRSETVIAQHPLRPPNPCEGTVVYSRFCVEVEQVLEFRMIDPGNVEDLHTFHRWMNNKRVNSAWGEQGDLEKHRAYVEGVSSDQSVLPLMMSWDGERMGYCELVWVKENHVAPYIPNGAHDYDRGLHVLVGEKKFRGNVYTQAWFRSIHHYIFLADSRTERVIGEPNRGNSAIMRTAVDAGMHLETSFYFPYKYSALMVGPRERFFKGDMLL